jgi:hypothetical protein
MRRAGVVPSMRVGGATLTVSPSAWASETAKPIARSSMRALSRVIGSAWHCASSSRAMSVHWSGTSTSTWSLLTSNARAPASAGRGLKSTIGRPVASKTTLGQLVSGRSAGCQAATSIRMWWSGTL